MKARKFSIKKFIFAYNRNIKIPLICYNSSRYETLGELNLNGLQTLKERIQNDKINLALSQEVEVMIDKFTPCLEHRESGEIYPTEVLDVTMTDLRTVGLAHGWNDFDWSIYIENPMCKVKKLTVRGDDLIQGLIAYEKKEGWVHIHLVESAPWNIQSKTFLGVGPHLFAIGCKESIDLGFDGFVTFVAKSKLIEHYQNTLNAQLFNPRTRLMVLDEAAAYQLVSTYF